MAASCNPAATSACLYVFVMSVLRVTPRKGGATVRASIVCSRGAGQTLGNEQEERVPKMAGWAPRVVTAEGVLEALRHAASAARAASSASSAAASKARSAAVGSWTAKGSCCGRSHRGWHAGGPVACPSAAEARRGPSSSSTAEHNRSRPSLSSHGGGLKRGRAGCSCERASGERSRRAGPRLVLELLDRPATSLRAWDRSDWQGRSAARERSMRPSSAKALRSGDRALRALRCGEGRGTASGTAEVLSQMLSWRLRLRTGALTHSTRAPWFARTWGWGLGLRSKATQESKNQGSADRTAHASFPTAPLELAESQELLAGLTRG